MAPTLKQGRETAPFEPEEKPGEKANLNKQIQDGSAVSEDGVGADIRIVSTIDAKYVGADGHCPHNIADGEYKIKCERSRISDTL